MCLALSVLFSGVFIVLPVWVSNEGCSFVGKVLSEVTEDDERVEEVGHGVCGAKSRRKSPCPSSSQASGRLCPLGAHLLEDYDLVRFFVSSRGSARTITRSCIEVPLGETTVTSSSTLPTSLLVSGRLISLRVITVEFPSVWVVTWPRGVGLVCA